MKVFFLFLAFGCLCEAAPAYVQGCVSSSATASVTCALTSVTSGNLLIMTSKTQAGTSTLATLTASSSSGVACTWAKVGTATNASSSAAWFNTQMAYCVIPSTGAETVQAAWTGSNSTFTDIAVAEYSNSTGWISSALDVSLSVSKTPATTTCAVGPSAATTNANDLVVSVCMAWNAAQTWGAATGYTNRAASSRNTTGFYDKSVTATGTQSFSVTIASDVDIAMIATFKQSGAAAVLRVLPNRVSF